MKPTIFKVYYKAHALVDPQFISDLLDCAFAGGSSYWAEIVDRDNLHQDLPLSEVPSAGGYVVLKDSSVEEGLELDLNWAACVRGLEVLAEIVPHHFPRILKGDMDAADGDAFLQCCLFGRVIYG